MLQLPWTLSSLSPILSELARLFKKANKQKKTVFFCVMPWKLPPGSNSAKGWVSPHYLIYVRDQNPMLPLIQGLKTFVSNTVSGFVVV